MTLPTLLLISAWTETPSGWGLLALGLVLIGFALTGPRAGRRAGKGGAP